ncbi:MAG: glutamine--fructose-6-phosphate transaminase (isomerizing) [Gammaproteobacteria bacterium]|nr:glutamine--fructose-6-phosphate transaminase (isomerizing) [Gammaproteobacteria bacterium]
MCGIVGGIAERNVVPILVEGLRRLEYRGYDSAGVAVVNKTDGEIGRQRSMGKVKILADNIAAHGLAGDVGIAHTRWATHGKPSEANAHPHICNGTIAVVHNGIIENHEELRERQKAEGFRFTSQTDTEVVAHEVFAQWEKTSNLLTAVQTAVKVFEGAYAIAVLQKANHGEMVVARKGSPLVVGIGIGEYFIASDVSALLPVTNKFVFLADGDVARITREKLEIFDLNDQPVQRDVTFSTLSADSADKGQYKHYMLKEIFEQPKAITDTLEGRTLNGKVVDVSFGNDAPAIFDKVDGVTILACGTSYHSGMVAKYWLESIAGMPTSVEIASEFRYRDPVPRKNNLVVTISQSGETADTLAALHEAKRLGFGASLVICNVSESSLVRESDLALMTRAGPEIGVASTKAFTTQLVALMLLTLALGRRRGLSSKLEAEIIHELHRLPGKIEATLKNSDEVIKLLAEDFIAKNHALFLGRGVMYPIAMEGALKLKEISYIHAEAYPAGELKHGPLALVDAQMPVITVAPNDDLLEKLNSNMQEVAARGGQLYVFADPAAKTTQGENIRTIVIEKSDEWISPILFTVPLQLLSYYVAVLRGTDVDQPRNLAKSVTVE